MGCFQVFEDHEGIEADILRRSPIGAGRRPALPVSGPALLVVSPRCPPRSHRSRLPHRPAARDPPPARLELRAASAVSYGAGPATPSPSPAGPWTGFGRHFSGSWSLRLTNLPV